jgi:formamidopyrimidine-DNA glycosylase
MPELPEVETIRSDLASQLRGRRIQSIAKGEHDYSGITRAAGSTIHQLRRRGKYLIADLGPLELVIHLGMSGRLFLTSTVPERPHLRAVLTLSGGDALVFVDRRRFGTLKVVAAGDYSSLPTLAAMGPEPLSPQFRLNRFSELVASSRAIKSVLLDQRVVAGLGNIYVDEALHHAGIHPATRGLSSRQARRLHSQIRRVLRDAIAHRGTTFSLYRDGLMKEGDYRSYLRVFGRNGLPCKACGAQIIKSRMAGRGTHFCPTCQPI